MRLFVALRPPDGVLAHLRAALPPGAPPLAPTVRTSRAGQEHVTLAFLGEVADPAPVLAQLRREAVQLPAPRLRLRGAGRFRGGAVWLGVDGDLEALARLAGAARCAAGVPLDQPDPWHPHLTVGRSRASVPAGLTAYEGPYGTWTDLALVRSDGGLHRDLQAWRLAAPEEPPGP